MDFCRQLGLFTQAVISLKPQRGKILFVDEDLGPRTGFSSAT
jgi:hypothetical protein